MKTTRRLFAIALALLLGLALLTPAASAADDPNAPVITVQPKETTFVKTGDTFTLEAQAALPENCANGELSYAWYDYDWQPGDTAPPVATGAAVNLPAIYDDSDTFPYPVRYYYVVVTNTFGEGETAFRKSNSARVNMIKDLGTALFEIWTRFDILTTLLTLPYPLFLSAWITLAQPLMLLMCYTNDLF